MSQNSQNQPKESEEAELFSDERLDQVLKDINMKRPHTPYIIFVTEEIKLIKSKNKDKTINLKEVIGTLSEKWSTLEKPEKEKYENLFQEEKRKYKTDIEFVRHYLFKDFNDTWNGPPTAYRLFLNQKLREELVQGISPKKIREKASNQWKEMPKDKQQFYKQKKKENDSWFSKAKNINFVSPLSMFIQKRIDDAKARIDCIKIPSFKEIVSEWKNLSKKEKKNFQKIADETNEEKKKLADIFEVVNGIKPKRPAGAFKLFLQEKAKNNEIKSLEECGVLWDKLNEDQKEEYYLKAHRCQLAYRYKEMIYKKKIKKMLPKRPRGAFQQFLKEKRGQKLPKGENWLIYWKNVFDHLPEKKINKYKQKAEEELRKYEKKMMEFQNKIFDMPKKPTSGFRLYLSERIPILKKENPNKDMPTLIIQISEEWNSKDDKDDYNKKAKEDQERFKKQLKEFNKKGYYTKDNGEEDKEEEDSKVKRKQIKKRTSFKDNSDRNRKKRTKSQNPKKRESRSRTKYKKGPSEI